MTFARLGISSLRGLPGFPPVGLDITHLLAPFRPQVSNPPADASRHALPGGSEPDGYLELGQA